VRVDSRTVRRAFVVLASLALVGAVAGCGSEGVVKPEPKFVIGTVKTESPGKAVFAANGCNGCHTFKAAGATGKVGPDLDTQLPADAKKAGKPLKSFTLQSIVDPNAFIAPGFPRGVMPETYRKLPPDQLRDLVNFLTTPQG
jgi:mono/diheme cytochrome c family protein